MCGNRHSDTQLRILCPGFFQDGDVGIGVFPEGEEVFVCRKCSNAGGIAISTLRSSHLQCVGTSGAQTRQGSRPAVPDNSVVVENPPELRGCRVPLARSQISLATNICRIEA